MKKIHTHILLSTVAVLFASKSSFSQEEKVQKDSIKAIKKNDSIPSLQYNFKHSQTGNLFLNNPSKYSVVFDKKLNKYIIVEKIGNFNINVPIFMTPEEYKKYRLKRDIKDYFKSKNSAINSDKKGSKETQKNLLPKYYVNSKFFESIFGSNTVEVIPRGNLTVKLGGIYQNIDNPQLSEENRSSFSFDFDQQISISLLANIGERLKVTANYDTQSTFDFQNIIKLEYAPTEDDIIRKIDAGNVSMPIKNSLINGAQSLFGVKTELQFGKTSVTAVFSQQNSESKTVVAEAGATINPFEIRATDYDDDRHFFLSHFFRENYENSLKDYPLISSPIQITRIEVWVTNRNSSTENFRSIVALADIGESDRRNLVNPTNVKATSPPMVLGNNIPANNANGLSQLLLESSKIRDISEVEGAVKSFEMKQGTDYSVLQNARKLESNEFSFNSHLGFISLNRKLSDGEVLAVAYEYTVVGSSGGSSFKVGEFSNDGIEAPKNIVVKLLRGEIINTKIPTWRLMMKNIYALGVFPLTSDGFRFEVLYRDDKTGVALNTLQEAKTPKISNKPLLGLLNLDKLDQSQNKKPDGFFDYVEGITVKSSKGLIIFPETEPFGKTLLDSLTTKSDSTYVFKELYSNTKSQAKNNYQNKDKFLLKGYAKSKNSGGIPLGAFNVPRGSVRVTAGGRQLVEGVDFVVDYTLGKVQIIDLGLQASGVPINVSTENNTIFNQQIKTFMGVEVEHRFSDKFLLSGTVLNVNERPITQKVNFGQEPINNTIFGLSVDYSTEMPLFTKWVNKLPFVDTDVPSNISVKADFAYLLPGTPSEIDINGQATSYIDDFEASQISIDLLSPRNWFMASTPKEFGGEENELSYNYKRAKLAWYSIDRIFYGGSKPSNIDNEELSRTEVRQVKYSELFKNTDLDITQNTSVRTLDLAYFPSERGPYNFDTDVKSDGTLSNPEDRWAGITRSLTTNNFDQANVEYIQFWLKDPYDENYSITNAEGLPLGASSSSSSNQIGKLYFNLGNISEDILKDNRKMYENGLPADGVKTNLNTVPTKWGRVPKNQSILYTFDVDNGARTNQDVGLDGLTDAEEKTLFPPDFSNLSDPASDNFQYFRGSDLDNAGASIITRYKSFNNTEGNSPTASQSKESYPTSSSSYPDVEDINKDQTMSTVESYWEYNVSLNKNELKKGSNKIVDEKTTSITLANGSTEKTKWYQFRIPIRSGTPVNNISNFNSIRFIRMFVTGFKIPVVLRFGQLEFVRGDYRRYTKTLDTEISPPKELSPEEKGNFEVGVVNIEQNEERYVVPPGIEREQLQGLSTIQYQNEQSASLKVTDLPEGETRAIYKNVSVDLRMYNKLKMFIHAEHAEGNNISKDDLVAIIRLGTDLDDNFYQMEVPLEISKKGSISPREVWPENNNLDVFLDDLVKIKLIRDVQIRLGNKEVATNELYEPHPDHFSKKELEDKKVFEDKFERFKKIKIKGNPTLADIRTLMLGVRNNSKADNSKSAEIWFNELRSSGFSNEGGWATVLSADANFADIADVSVTGKIQTIGFGNVEDRVTQRSIEETKQYNVSTNISLGKMMPKKWGIQLPMSYSIGEEFRDPKYDVQYQDVKFADAKKVNTNSKNAQDYTLRKSISFTNVKKNRNPESKRKPKLYDIENIFVSYSFTEEFHKDYNIEKYINQNLTASAGYNFAFKSKFIEPFKESSFFGKSKHWQLIKDININLLPKSIGVNSRITRSYSQQKSRNLIEGLSAQRTLTQRRFLFDWDYNISFDLTKSLKLQFNANNSYIYDDFERTEDVEIFNQFFNTGRPDHYTQKLNATYKVPIDKIPFLSFVSADYGYTANFDWKSASPTYAEKTGNLLQNSNTHNINTIFSFDKLYKESGFEKLFVKSKKKKQSVGHKLLLGVYDAITSVKNAKLSYSENNGTLLPGYIGRVGFLGRDNINGSFAPTLGFVFGSQIDIRNKALENGWLVKSRDAVSGEYFNKTYSTTHYNKLDYTVSIKPFKDLDIDIQGNKIQTKNISQQLDVVNNGSDFGSLAITPTSETGNFSTSYSMFFTAFKSGDALFQELKDNRSIIANRLVTNERPDNNKFGSQEVLLPAFLATYSGSNPNSVKLGAFRNVPIPNWTLRYNGFMKMDWFKKNFTSFTVSNGYKSSYTISNFTNNLNYRRIINPAAGNYESELLISSASLIDEFSPLIKIDIKMRNSFSFKGEIKKDRTLTLNFDNSTLTEIKGTEFVFGVGYIIKNVRFSTSISGEKQKFKGDVNIRADMSLRDNLTLIRSVTDTENNQISGGQKLISIKFVADYKLNRNLTASFYYDYSTSRYAISTSFPRQSINTGLNIIYNLGN